MHIPDKFLYLIFQIEFYSNLFPRVRFSFPTISFPFWIFASKLVRRSFLRVQKLHDSKTIINEILILFPFHSESSIKAERSLNTHTHADLCFKNWRRKRARTCGGRAASRSIRTREISSASGPTYAPNFDVWSMPGNGWGLFLRVVPALERRRRRRNPDKGAKEALVVSHLC